eukprot:comp22106_c0_seq1/m.51405 comp22106_c0_seq1/g.51405  ORF comp22106_c0_seq1/g.51405 comp22106_c0_seq1/m.51405 type:complete len:337 (+) comp22106_c0_seq1:1691-2701(+)
MPRNSFSGLSLGRMSSDAMSSNPLFSTDRDGPAALEPLDVLVTEDPAVVVRAAPPEGPPLVTRSAGAAPPVVIDPALFDDVARRPEVAVVLRGLAAPAPPAPPPLGPCTAAAAVAAFVREMYSSGFTPSGYAPSIDAGSKMVCLLGAIGRLSSGPASPEGLPECGEPISPRDELRRFLSICSCSLISDAWSALFDSLWLSSGPSSRSANVTRGSGSSADRITPPSRRPLVAERIRDALCGVPDPSPSLPRLEFCSSTADGSSHSPTLLSLRFAAPPASEGDSSPFRAPALVVRDPFDAPLLLLPLLPVPCSAAESRNDGRRCLKSGVYICSSLFRD